MALDSSTFDKVFNILVTNVRVVAGSRRHWSIAMSQGTWRQMRFALLTGCVVALVAQAGTEAQQTAPKPSAGRLTFAAGSVSFVAPPGFTALTVRRSQSNTREAGPLARRSATPGGRRRLPTICRSCAPPSNDLEALRRSFCRVSHRCQSSSTWQVTSAESAAATGRMSSSRWPPMIWTSTTSCCCRCTKAGYSSSISIRQSRNFPVSNGHCGRRWRRLLPRHRLPTRRLPGPTLSQAQLHARSAPVRSHWRTAAFGSSRLPASPR